MDRALGGAPGQGFGGSPSSPSAGSCNAMGEGSGNASGQGFGGSCSSQRQGPDGSSVGFVDAQWQGLGASGFGGDSRPAVTVVKVGGGVLEDCEKQAALLKGFAAIEGAKVLVHGGGREATSLAARLGIEAKMVEGRRITDAAMLEIVTMTYGGLVNKRLVAGLQALGINAMGLTGADLHCITAHRRPIRDGLDFGYVGDIDNVDGAALSSLIAGEIVPVLAPLSFDGRTLLNTNADTIASCTATALAKLHPVQLTFCFEKEGVLDAEGAVIEQIDKQRYEELKACGTVSAGMLPKLDNAFAALDKGVQAVRITSFQSLTGGTTICP